MTLRTLLLTLLLAVLGAPAHALEVVNDEGTWVGTGRYVGPLGVSLSTLTGEGAYEGLTAFVTEAYDDLTDEDFLEAVIIEGGLPPFPEPAQ